jgi:hypothetical protein
MCITHQNLSTAYITNTIFDYVKNFKYNCPHKVSLNPKVTVELKYRGQEDLFLIRIYVSTVPVATPMSRRLTPQSRIRKKVGQIRMRILTATTAFTPTTQKV